MLLWGARARVTSFLLVPTDFEVVAPLSQANWGVRLARTPWNGEGSRPHRKSRQSRSEHPFMETLRQAGSGACEISWYFYLNRLIITKPFAQLPIY